MSKTSRIVPSLLLLGTMACGPNWKQYHYGELGVTFLLPATAVQETEFYSYPFGRTYVNHWFTRFQRLPGPLDYPAGFGVSCYRLFDRGAGLPRPDQVFEAERKRLLLFPGASLVGDDLASTGNAVGRELRIQMTNDGITSVLIERVVVVGPVVVTMQVHTRKPVRNRDVDLARQFFSSLVVEGDRKPGGGSRVGV